ncbi:MAG: hypothetical protein AAGB34_06280 [Planctomycetota bacterium]
MGQLSRAIAAIKDQLGGMTATQKLLIASLGVIMAMTLFVVSQYTSGPKMVPLLIGAEASDHEQAVQFLRAKGIPFELSESGEALVAPGRIPGIMASMSEEGRLPTDTALTFNSMVEKQSWLTTHQQNEQAAVVALQNELANVIRHMSGIESARVIVDVPKRRIGQPDSVPTASAAVKSNGGLDQNTVDAIAYLIASSRAGLTAERVRVIDQTTGRQHRARSDDDYASAGHLEHQAKHEERTREQIYQMLSGYIPGVVVSVRAQVDIRKKTVQKKEVFNEGEGTVNPLVSDLSDQMESNDSPQAAEPGARANVTADINTGGGGGSSTTSTRGEQEFSPEFGGETTTIAQPGGFATKMNAVINIPRTYFVSVWSQRNPPAEDAGGDEVTEPTNADLLAIIEEETDRIQREVGVIIDTSSAEGAQQGEVMVSMIPTMPDFGLGGVTAGGGSVLGVPMGTITSPEMIRSLGLGGLALLSLGLVVFTAFKANKKEDLPSAADLVGLPPELGTDQDLVGEALSIDEALAGVELSDGELERRKRAEQIAAMVEENPEEAAMIVKRWMSEGE